jgi:hypothetical protein
MSNIFTAAEGTYLFVDTDSLVTEVKSTLDRLGLDSIVRPRYHSRSPVQHVDFRLPDLKIAGPNGEDMEALLRVENSSRPGTALSVKLGIYRMVCSNGLFGFSMESLQRIVHRVGPTAYNKLEGLPAAVEGSVKYVDHMRSVAESLADTVVVDPIGVIASLPILQKTKDMAISQVARQAFRPEDQPYTAWGLYNIVNEIDRLQSKSSIAHAQRDERLVDDILCLTQAYDEVI